MNNNYSWVNTHKGIVHYLSDKENSQQELIGLLKSIGITGFNDRTKPGKHDIELREIDPFTFFGYIHKHGPERALGYLQQIAELLNLDKPTTVYGIPTAQALRVWLFPPEYLRVNNEVARLWNLFKKELNGEVDDDVFADALDIKNVGRAKLTEALFYINPEKYLPINGPTIPYIKKELGVNAEFTTYSEYIELLEKIRGKTDLPFYELSHEAWVWNKENTSDDPIRVMIEEYKTHIRKKELKDEEYKWELIEEFKGRPNLEVENLLQELKSIKYHNLMYAMGKAVLYRLAQDRTEELRELLTQLFDETRDLTERVKLFNKQSLKLYRELESKLGHHQDERSISTYLTFRYPEEYTFYKYSYYKFYCELLGVAKAKKNERYTHYLSLIDELIEEYIIPDVELIEQVKSYIPEYYDGKNNKLLAQDILFQMERRNAKVNYWVFQGNPDKYDFEAAFKEDDIDAWTVTSHKASIKEGDKVIIWITGDKAGCYALADVVSEPMDRESFADSDLWKEEDTSELKAAINITHNLASNPILKDEIDKIKDLDNLKVESQGTNFSATKQEYETLLELAVKREDSMNYREGYINWLRNKYGDRSGTISAYEKAIDILSKILSVEIFEISDIKYLDDLYKDLIKEQRNEKGRYYHPDAPSYGNNGFYSASIMSYMEFLVSKQKPVKQSKEKMITPSNTILYGPPGTGKTYNTINEALKIIDNKFFEENIDNRQALNKRFRELRFNPSTGEGQIAFITFHQSLSYEDFIEGIKPVKYEGEENVRYEVCSGLFKSIANNANNDRIEHEEDNANKPYVIIIDEINRGNISQIFGELITLIEPDKRKGQAEEIEVILPYSKERFSVPSNLHIIGTMNTADRSVEALDTALRRRFSFVEMNPVPGLLSKDEFGCKGVDLEAMLRAINGRIEKLLDRDYCIGHSYFMTIMDKQEPLEELKYIFQNKILPLLQEYFYGDWGKIRLIVGKEFVDRRKSDVDFLDEEGEEDIEEFEDRTIYSFTDCEGWTLDSFKSIYEEK